MADTQEENKDYQETPTQEEGEKGGQTSVDTDDVDFESEMELDDDIQD